MLNSRPMELRRYETSDQDQVAALWKECGLATAANNPYRDIQRKTANSPELFFVGEEQGQIVASCMAGYDWHRGWIYYLAAAPSLQGKGLNARIMRHAEKALLGSGCPKIGLMVGKINARASVFCSKMGCQSDPGGAEQAFI
ncbi:Acetyltransferase (GNAT) family protein [Desulfatibacillum alkenivorans DSM 16219]|uniref:Acetyltransferase (GNAT) family protein n=1 Tax=Desulfatibacillum alkenivorans DSM 16219 TaxID=1121393 RepID=A0A1M6R6N5_9BACT|nr:GNAT family acetyltransferase [Desulfatibacillum alkenivorans]SHK28135.1 Acetyltransferase (GNAT) family protein [Desulfatibacillum alkenivorans DSM 16219]